MAIINLSVIIKTTTQCSGGTTAVSQTQCLNLKSVRYSMYLLHIYLHFTFQAGLILQCHMIHHLQ